MTGGTTGFNSILVRLKATVICPSESIKKGFNSILVRLKVHQSSKQYQEKAGFNSILVRLKGFAKATDILYAILMVRVKSILATGIFKGRCCRPAVVQIYWEVDGSLWAKCLGRLLSRNSEFSTISNAHLTEVDSRF